MTGRVLVSLGREEAAALSDHDSVTFRGGEKFAAKLAGERTIAAALEVDREQLVEQVARVLCEADNAGKRLYDPSLAPWHQQPRWLKDRLRAQARAVLDVLEGQ